jgi:trimethylguanosine synthase
MDTSPTRLALARHNAQIYGVAHRIEFVLGDYLSFAKSYADRLVQGSRERTIDVVFLSPPWGGPEYLISPGSSTQLATDAETARPPTPDDTTQPEYTEYTLSSIRPIHGKQLFDVTRQITSNIAYFLPRNTKLEEVGSLVNAEPSSGVVGKSTQSKGKEKMEMIEVEEEWMGNKLKALTCYFGGLVQGQEDRF